MSDDREIIAGINPSGSITAAKMDANANLLASLATVLAGENMTNGWMEVRQAAPPAVKIWTSVDLGVNGLTLGSNRDTEWIDVRGYSRLFASCRLSAGTASVDMFGTPILTADAQNWGQETDWFWYICKKTIPLSNGTPQWVSNAFATAYTNGGDYQVYAPHLAKVKLRLNAVDAGKTGWLWMIGLP